MGDVISEVSNCTRCALHARSDGPHPIRGAPATIAVLVEAPGRNKHESNLLRRLLEKAEIPLSQCAFVGVVSCRALDENGRERRPSQLEVSRCAGHREAQLAFAGATRVLLAGELALQLYRPDLRIAQAHGRPFGDPNGRAYLATLHPGAVLRHPTWQRTVLQDLETFRSMLGNERWTDALRLDCVSCGASVEEMRVWRCDPQGIAYCDVHVPPSN